MKIDELIDTLVGCADYLDTNGVDASIAKLCRTAAETIKLLWEVAKDTTNAQYKRQIDEMRGDNT